MAADFCRLCLRPIDKAKSTDLVTETTKSAMLKEFLPEMNLDISENTQVCSSCIEELETSYNFKHGVVVNETNIQTKLEENDLKKIDLKLMLDDVAKKEVKTADYVCRTCFSICRTPSISLFDSPTNMMPYSFVKKMCQVVFELEFIAADKPVLCDDCWETLQTVYNFRKCCLRTDKKLRIFVANKNITKVNNDEFKEFAEENPPKDDAEDSSDDELDEYIKEEPVDADEIKFDPDEASCSSSSVKVKKETAVKSESELNSEDEDMEDEPELLDPKTIKSEASELDGEECKMEIGDVKVDAEGEGSAGPSGKMLITNSFLQHHLEISLKEPPPLIWFVKQKNTKCTRSDNLQKCPFPQCTFQAGTKLQLRRHIPIHQWNGICKMYTCTYCTFSTKKKSYLRYHELIHQPDDVVQIFKCAHCLYKTKRKRDLKNHFLTHQPDTLKIFTCSRCPFRTKWKASLKLHQRTHEANDTVQVFTCTQCSYMTKIKSHLRRHEIIHMPVQMFACTDCSYKTRTKSYLERHKLIHQPHDVGIMFRCALCPYKTRRKSALRQHGLIHQPDDAVPMFACNYCSYRNRYKSVLRNHLMSHHGLDHPV